jgi:hypothetical protein
VSDQVVPAGMCRQPVLSVVSRVACH